MKNSDVLYHQKIEKLKESKLNKNIIIAKTLEAFKPKKKTFKKPISKTCSKPFFISEIGPVLYLQDLKKNLLALEDRLTRK